MIVAGSASPLLLSSAGGYNLTRSLRFRSSASAYLNRTPATTTNQKIWTFSTWVKRGSLTSYQDIFSGGDSSSNCRILFNAGAGSQNDNIFVFFRTGGTFRGSISNAVFRDPSAWYHLVVAIDTTQATDTNRVKIYINGVQQTTNNSYGSGYVPQNTDTGVNTTTEHRIGDSAVYTPSFLDGYLTEINFIDGQALTPSSFGQNNAQTGVWQPKRYTGTYGTNGFYLPFSDNSSLSNLTADRSGNGNNWTANNISLTAGATYDSMTDVPTLTSTTQANYCTINPLSLFSPSTVSGGNLNVSTGVAGFGFSYGTIAIPTSGKWYWEYTPTSNGNQSFCGVSVYQSGAPTNALAYYAGTGERYVNNVASAYGATYTNNDVIGVAVDVDAGTVTFYKNNTSQGAISYATSSGAYFPFFADGTSGTSTDISVNFGQRPFAYTPPTGFVALNTFNLPTPTIGATASTQANKFFDATLYNGTGSSLTVTNAGGFQPDLLWQKPRSTANNNWLTDSVRGNTKILTSNDPASEFTVTDCITSINSNGFTLGTNSSFNGSGTTNVMWQWRAANGNNVTNTAGSITSTISANTSSGFSIVTYTGTGANATVGHGLGVAPKMVIVKNRATNSPENTNWRVYHASTGNTGGLFLNTTAAFGANSTFWNDTTPTSSVFSIGTDIGVNNSGITYVAYCFAEVAGFSRFGSYTGNGSSDGTFVFTGFRPRYIIFKRTDSTGSWFIRDTARDPSNVGLNYLRANTSDAEANTGGELDYLSNGFKWRASSAEVNASGGSYIYMAFAENPFKYSLAR